MFHIRHNYIHAALRGKWAKAFDAENTLRRRDRLGDAARYRGQTIRIGMRHRLLIPEEV